MIEHLKLNLGCGYRKVEGFVNIDNRAECAPDLLHDLTDGLPYDDNSVEYVLATDVLEHLPFPFSIEIVEEVWRVLQPGGTFEFVVPSTDGRGAYQDPTHRSFWNINTWLYFTDDNYRNLHGFDAKFEVEGLQDHITDNMLRVIHTHGVLKAVKGVEG